MHSCLLDACYRHYHLTRWADLPQSETYLWQHLVWHRGALWHGEVDQAVQGLQRLAKDLPAEEHKTVKEAMRYLENQRGWIGSYENWCKQGYPVGSGMIERAVALVINRRMKKRGMRWKRANATAIVALRTDALNHNWQRPASRRAFP